MTIDDLLRNGEPPIVAILRGVKPDEAVAIAEAVFDAGIRMIEVPFNSPDPTDSIRRIVARFGHSAIIGGGTVLSPADADALADAGGRIMVTPNTDAAVIARAVARGLEPMPGFGTVSEAFVAIGAGATRLKLFPAGAFGPAYLKAVREVLPRHVGTWAVGGTGADTLSAWFDAGAEGIGVGGALYRAGDSADQVADKARALVTAWNAHGDCATTD